MGYSIDFSRFSTPTGVGSLSVLYLVQGYRDDPSGNWHELTRAGIVLIGVTAYELATKIPIKNLLPFRNCVPR